MSVTVAEASIIVSESKSRRIVLAQIASAHGIKGDVVVRTHTGDPEDLGAYGPLSDASGKRVFEITHLRVTAKGVIVRFKGIADRTAAEGLRGTDLYVERAALPPAGDGAYYHVDLIGLAAESPDGAAVGTVIAVQNFGAGELLEIKRPGVTETDYIPFTDTFVPTVDIAGGRVVVIVPEMVGDPEPAASDDETAAPPQAGDDADDWTCRMAERRDLAGIIDLMADDMFGKARNPKYDAARAAYDAAFADMDGNADNTMIVAERGGRLIGCYQLTFIRGLSHSGALRAQVESVRVASDLRGQGLGGKLMGDAIARARGRGANILQLTTDIRRPQTRSFYERLGFIASHHGMKLAL